MAGDFIQPLNYSAHAIDDLRIAVDRLRHQVPISAQVISGVIELLQRSIKFILPNCCDIFDVDSLDQKHLDLVRLPFPIVAFEAPWEKDAPLFEVNGVMQTRATRRIALCWEPEAYELLPGMSDWLQVFPAGGVFVLPIYYCPGMPWQLGFGCIFQPYENVVTPVNINEGLPASRMAVEAILGVGGRINKHTKQFKCEPVPILIELFEAEATRVGRNEALAAILLDCGDETNVLIQACATINCNNVESEVLPAPAALNKKRVARGKQPFFEYKVLQLTGEASVKGAAGGGDHATPRTHLRRGHLRRLDAQRVIWVRAAVVNPNSPRGKIDKDYSV